MQVYNIQENIFQLNTFFEPVNFSFNQYLLKGNSPILVQTGPVFFANEVISAIDQILKGQPLGYIFVSHFESDECGGLAALLARYPEVKVICGETTARQLVGFGITGNAIIQKAGQSMKIDSRKLEFIPYAAEMHMWEGLVLYEKTSKILFSSDLFIRFGKFDQAYLESNLKSELTKLEDDKMLAPNDAKNLWSSISKLDIQTIATGHGPYLKV